MARKSKGNFDAEKAAGCMTRVDHLAQTATADREGGRPPKRATAESRRPDSNRGPLHYESVEKAWS